MKKSFIVSGAILFIGAILAVWLYLLIFGTPVDTDGEFAIFGQSDAEEIDRAPLPTGVATELETTVDLSTTLSQLTTRAVVGYTLLEGTASTTPRVRYVERGVGHMYELDLVTGLETRILGKTFTGITDAVLAPGGNTIVLIAENGSDRTVYLETTSEVEVMHELPSSATELAFTSPNELRYALSGATETFGYSYDLTTKDTKQLFVVPFAQITVLWSVDAIWIYNKPAPFLEGALYEVMGNTMRRVGDAGYSLSALAEPYGMGLIITQTDGTTDALISTYVADEQTLLPATVIPEKCTFDTYATSDTIWCGDPVQPLTRTQQAEWYQGMHASDDLLWRVDLDTKYASAEVDFKAFIGRQIDVIDISIDVSGTRVLFRNKIDGTLWLYSIEPEEITGGAEDTNEGAAANDGEIED